MIFNPEKPIFVIDNSILLNQAVHHYEPVHGYLDYIHDLIEVFKIEDGNLYFALDGKPPTLRQLWLREYKGHRPPKTEDFLQFKYYIEQILLPKYYKEKILKYEWKDGDPEHTYEYVDSDDLELQLFGNKTKIEYESDDIIATVVKQHPELEFYIITKDLDMAQLVNKKVTLLKDLKAFQLEHVNPAYVKWKFRITPEQIPDFKALAGDSADNYKGVPGIGTLKAGILLNRYKNLDSIYKAIDEDKFVVDEETAVWETTLKDNREQAYLCLRLATLFPNVPRISL